ncbi:endolytic transglycosylase MltG [Bacillaceae bacterium]
MNLATRYALLILSVLLTLAGGTAVYLYKNLRPMPQGDPVIVTIPPGISSRAIGELLEDKQLIRDGRLFAYYVRYQGVGNRLQAGTYRFTPGQSLSEIVSQLKHGDTYEHTLTVTIPEGFTVEQIAARLAEKKLVDKEKFLQEVNRGDFPFEFVKQIPKKNGVKYRLEGYLFPQTYVFDTKMTEHEIIARMLAQFEKEFAEEWKRELKRRGLSIHKAVILASIVEREVAVAKERKTVAGVLYNRLRDGMPLQVDATIQFALGKQKERLTYKDLRIDHPYNTYLHAGLPPGPIANPGKSALEAVVYPEKHNFYYYVTKKDGSQEHYFSQTYAEHQRKIALSRMNQAGRKSQAQ